MPHLTLRDFSCHYIYENLGHPQTLILSNSLGCTTQMWEENVEELKHHFNILRYDNRGHGKSTSSYPDARIADLAQDVLQLIDALQLHNTIFCGLSIGGQIGLWLSLHAADRFDKIIISNTAPKIGTLESWNERINLIKTHGLQSLVAPIEERWFTEETRKNKSEKVKEIMQLFTQTSLEGYLCCAKAVAHADFNQQLASIQIPLLILSGRYDQTTTTEDAQKMKEAIYESEHIDLASNHLSNIDCTETFNKAIIDFIKK